jgi:ketosteroid isomerase-like protein
MNTLVLLLVAAAAQAPPSTAEPCRAADAGVRASVERLHRLDADASKSSGAEGRSAILALLTDDVVMIAPDSAPVVGKTAWGEVLEKTDESAGDWIVDSYVEDYPEIVVCGTLAYEWGAITTIAHNKKSGRNATQVGNSMRILKLTPSGNWLIHRAMFSTRSVQ